MFVQFDSTAWSLIERAGQNNAKALAQLVNRYEGPLKAYLQVHGWSHEDAEDLTQEVFMSIISKEVLDQADPERGLFRTLLLRVVKNLMINEYHKRHALKRGGDQVIHSLEAPLGDTGTPLGAKLPGPADVDDGTFDALWVKHLLNRAMDRLQEGCQEKGTFHYEVLSQFLFQDMGHEALGALFGRSINQIKQDLHQARAKLKRYLAEEVAHYCPKGSFYDQEIAFLKTYLGDLS